MKDMMNYLSLDDVMVLRIGKNDSYMVTISGEEDRYLIKNGQKEISIIEECLKNNIELERKSIKDYMPSDYIEIYKELLVQGKYNYCLDMLKGIENYINNIYKEGKELLLIRRKGV